MQTIEVNHSSGKYPIFIDQNLFDQDKVWLPIAGKQVMVITNDKVAPLYLNKIINKLSPHYQVDSLILADGEKFKTLDQMSKILDELISRGHHRDTTLI